jgi:cyclopropane fatty-acyl-phospholipid synthase-like methyltransferase
MSNCYLCGFTEFNRRKGQVRDNSKLIILECSNCGLVFLNTTDHISSCFYEASRMHGAEPYTMEEWLNDTEQDDQRRYDMLKALLPNKRLLDFGCGAAGFLRLAKSLAAEVTGIELEARVADYWARDIRILPSLQSTGSKYDLITSFHVLEHLSDPRLMLTNLASALKKNGQIIVEVPSSGDALLNLYDCEAFQRFTYWSQHLFLFNSSTLEILVRQAGLRVVAMKHYQRYSLSNHLYWLSQGKSGGHQRWSFLDSPELSSAYANTLAALGKTDTLIAHLEHID